MYTSVTYFLPSSSPAQALILLSAELSVPEINKKVFKSFSLSFLTKHIQYFFVGQLHLLRVLHGGNVKMEVHVMFTDNKLNNCYLQKHTI